jgi:membrane-associated protease RseP (regulator of RpoE activity)
MTDIKDSTPAADEPRSAGSGGPAPDEHPGTGNTVLRLGVLVGLLVLLGVLGSWWYVVVVVALLFMIFMHELGHYLAAKRAGMKVTEFFLGFGPRLWSTRRGEVEYGIKAWVPIGAYVKIVGMSNLDEVDPADEDRTYRSKPYWSRFSVAVAGSAMHFAMALVLLFVLLAGFGVPRADTWVVNTLTPGSPATQVGLLRGDQIVAIDGQDVSTFEDLTSIVRERPGETVTLTVVRDGETIELTPTLASRNPDGQPVGFLGIGRTYPYVRESVTSAVPAAFEEFGRVSWLSVTGLVKVFSPGGIRDYVGNFTNEPAAGTGTPENRLVSPVGVVQVGGALARNGTADLLFFFAAVNIFIGIFNLVPLPPFDGGHVAVATYEAVRSRRGRRYHADVRKLLPIAYAVLGVLLVLLVGNLYLDLTRPIL